MLNNCTNVELNKNLYDTIYYEAGAVARKQVFGSEGMVAEMGCQAFALCGWVFVFCLFKSGENYHLSGFLIAITLGI